MEVGGGDADVPGGGGGGCAAVPAAEVQRRNAPMWAKQRQRVAHIKDTKRVGTLLNWIRGGEAHVRWDVCTRATAVQWHSIAPVPVSDEERVQPTCKGQRVVGLRGKRTGQHGTVLSMNGTHAYVQWNNNSSDVGPAQLSYLHTSEGEGSDNPNDEPTPQQAPTTSKGVGYRMPLVQPCDYGTAITNFEERNTVKLILRHPRSEQELVSNLKAAHRLHTEAAAGPDTAATEAVDAPNTRGTTDVGLPAMPATLAGKIAKGKQSDAGCMLFRASYHCRRGALRKKPLGIIRPGQSVKIGCTFVLWAEVWATPRGLELQLNEASPHTGHTPDLDEYRRLCCVAGLNDETIQTIKDMLAAGVKPAVIQADFDKEYRHKYLAGTMTAVDARNAPTQAQIYAVQRMVHREASLEGSVRPLKRLRCDAG